MSEQLTPDDVRELLQNRRTQRMARQLRRQRRTKLMMLAVIPALGALVAAGVTALLGEYSAGVLLVTAVVVYLTSAVSGYLLMGATHTDRHAP